MQPGRELEHVARRAQGRAERGVEVEHVAERADLRLGRRLDGGARILESRADRVDHEIVLAPILGARAQGGGRGGQIARVRHRARERVAQHEVAVAADQALGRGGDQGARAGRLDHHAHALGVPIVQRGEQAGGAHGAAELHAAGSCSDDLRALAARDRIRDVGDLAVPFVGGGRAELHERRLLSIDHATGESGAEDRELVPPAGGGGGVVRVDREDEEGARTIMEVGPAGQREPSISEAGPRRPIGGTRSEGCAAQKPRPREPESNGRRELAGDHRAARAGVRLELEIARRHRVARLVTDLGRVGRDRMGRGDHLGPACTAGPAQLARDAHTDERQVRRRPRHDRLIPQLVDDRRGGEHGRRQRDVRQPFGARGDREAGLEPGPVRNRGDRVGPRRRGDVPSDLFGRVHGSSTGEAT